MHIFKKQQIAFPLALLICFIALPFHPAKAVGLKENSIITDNTIKLGDIFYDLPRNKERVIGNAPNPGDNITLNARTLLRIAIALDLSWRPNSASDNIILRREATVIEYEQIKGALLGALKNDGINGDYEIKIPKQYHKIILPYNQPADMVITRFETNAKRNKFEATIAAPSAENPIQHIKITGQIYSVITVPVLVQNLQHGSIITQNNIEYIKIREIKFARDTIIDANKIIGMTARKMIIAGRPIKASETIAPQVVKRGSLITLSLQSGVMNLTTQVKALQNGAKGDVIRVVNLISNKTLHATIVNENEVSVVQN